MKKTVLYVLGGLLALGVLASMCDSGETSEGSTNDSIAKPASTSQKTWTVQTSTDEMRGTKDTFATLESDNEAEFEFPYAGGSTLKFTVRKTAKFGTGVLLSIHPGQFNSTGLEGSDYVTIKFDDGPLKKYHYNVSGSGDMDVIFLKKEQELISKLKTAKKIMVEATFFQEGVEQFTFTVDKTLEWEL